MEIVKNRDISKLLDYARNYGLGMIVLVALLGFLYKIFTLPVSPAQILQTYAHVFLGLGVLAWIVAAYTLFRNEGVRNNFQEIQGLVFIVAVSLVLFSYSVAWHLYFPYFKYNKLLAIIAVLILASLQSAFLSKMNDGIHKSTEQKANSAYWVIPVAGISLVVFIIAVIVAVRNIRFEDIFITFRYGYHLANGNGINWNINDPIPSEGYTTFIYVLIAAFFYWIKLDPLVGTQVINGFSLLGLGYLCWKLGKEIFNDQQGYRSFLAVVLLFVMPATAFHIATGMETIFYAMTLTAISLVAVYWHKSSKKNSRLIFSLGLMILLSGLTRPDGIVYGFITIVILLLYNHKELIRKNNIIALVISLVLPGSIYFAWRFSYYKYILPLSFYHKSFTGDLYGHATRSVLFTDFIAMLVLVYLGIILYRIFSGRISKAALLIFIPSLLLVLYYSRVLAVAGLEYRFFFPYLSSFIILAGNDLSGLIDRLAYNVPKPVIVVVSLLLFGYLTLAPFFFETKNNIEFYARGVVYDEMSDQYPRIGKALLNIEPSQPIGIGEVGKIGMILKDYTLIDIVGLNDRYLARNPFSTQYLDDRGVNVLITYPYPREFLGVYSDVYHKVGEGFNEIEKNFLCIGNIKGLDVFIRRNPETLVQHYIQKLSNSSDFQQVCLSSTTARWSINEKDFFIDSWETRGLEKVETSNLIAQYKVIGDDPMIISPQLNLIADDYNYVIVNSILPEPIDCSVFSVYFIKEGEMGEGEDRAISINFKPSAKEQPIVFNVQSHPKWSGRISRVRLDPVCGNNSTGSPVMFSISQVIFR